MSLTEVRLENEQAKYFLALNKGWHLGPDGSQDNHGPNWGAASTRTGLLAPNLTRPDILDTIYSHRTFSATDRNIEIVLLANGHWMGEVFDETADTAQFVIQAFDPDIGDIITTLQLFEDGVEIASVSPSRRAYTWIYDIPAASRYIEHHYVVKATQGDGDKAWTAPLWITFATEPEPMDHWLFC